MIRRAMTCIVIALAAVAAAPGTVSADPAGPTDYRSEIVEIRPATSTIEVSILGGDSFVEVRAEPGTEVTVMGYAGEPYLRIAATGEVFENRRSPAYFYNQERFGAEIPTSADPDADPDWHRVGGGSTWAWHDHRAHRMETFAPLNAQRGDQVLDAVVPLIVDGTPVDVHVISTWMPAPSRAPGLLGALIGIALTASAALGGRFVGRRTTGDPVIGRMSIPAVSISGAALAVLVLALAATAIGVVQYRSLPAATDPLIAWWLGPLSAAVFATAALVGWWRAPASRSVLIPGALALAGVQLMLWAVQRRTGLVRAVLPTDAPYWLDRLVTAAALTGGLVGTLVAVAVLAHLALSPGTRVEPHLATSPSPRSGPARSTR